LFTVLSKNTHDGKAIRMLVQNAEIIFLTRGSAIELRVNNQEKTLRTGHPIQIREDERDEER